MFLPFFNNLRDHKIPVSLREFLTFLEGMQVGLATYDIDHFYLLSRTILVKDERNLDKFDLAFSSTFQGLESINNENLVAQIELPEEWPVSYTHLTLPTKRIV